MITYYLNRPEAEKYPLVVILQGSECLTVAHKYDTLIQPLAEAGVAVLRVEKPGLSEAVPVGECPEEYLRLNSPQRRVLDLVAVLAAMRREEPSWNGRLGVLGGSEGAMIAALASPLLEQTQGVVLLSAGGGLSFAEEILLGVRQQMLASGADEGAVEQQMQVMRDVMEEMRDNPTPFKEWGSDGDLARNTYLWWSQAMPLRLSIPLLQSQVPLLIFQGEDDVGTPLESGLALKQQLQEGGREHFEFRTYKGGHAPPTEVLQASLQWLISKLREN